MLCSKSLLTNASRGTANAWHFYYALVFVICSGQLKLQCYAEAW
ncbi:DUF3265 domain-containing protein [Vibrio cholerae]|nr:DUF3265 domain-containing protein [Vibrio cholerae]